MKMIAFTVNPSERPIFERYYRDYGIELTITTERPKLENAHLTQGADCINVLSDTAIPPELGMNIADAQAMLQRWSLEPEAEEFTSDPKKKAVVEKYMAAEDDYSMLEGNDPLGIGKPGSTFWHYDMAKRPSKRDLTKAKIFMAEIIEDYFLTTSDDPRPPYAMYTCIS